MNTNWIKVFIAAFFEVFWVIGLKHADDFWTWTGTVISIIISFYLMIMAGRNTSRRNCICSFCWIRYSRNRLFRNYILWRTI